KNQNHRKRSRAKAVPKVAPERKPGQRQDQRRRRQPSWQEKQIPVGKAPRRPQLKAEQRNLKPKHEFPERALNLPKRKGTANSTLPPLTGLRKQTESRFRRSLSKSNAPT